MVLFDETLSHGIHNEGFHRDRPRSMCNLVEFSRIGLIHKHEEEKTQLPGASLQIYRILIRKQRTLLKMVFENET